MNFSYPQIMFQEVPDEISLSFCISGCDLRCVGCHSAETWNPNFGQKLEQTIFDRWLSKYSGMATCVLFFGGEWESDGLADLLCRARAKGFKTALYTGREMREVPECLLSNLNYLKVGPYVKALGGLQSPTTNQRFYNLDTNEDVTHRFTRC